VQFLVVFLVVWLVFAVTAFYVSNVTLWGWRRVVVGHDVFVDKGFRPGQVPLVLGGDDLLPGELICGKWDNARSVLRRIAGNPGPERSASEKEDEVQ
jgi:hypothetical protein